MESLHQLKLKHREQVIYNLLREEKQARIIELADSQPSEPPGKQRFKAHTPIPIQIVDPLTDVPDDENKEELDELFDVTLNPNQYRQGWVSDMIRNQIKRRKAKKGNTR